MDLDLDVSSYICGDNHFNIDENGDYAYDDDDNDNDDDDNDNNDGDDGDHKAMKTIMMFYPT